MLHNKYNQMNKRVLKAEEKKGLKLLIFGNRQATLGEAEFQ